MRHSGFSAAFLLLAAQQPLATAAEVAQGCYARTYAGDHLAAHPRQFVTRIALLVKTTEPAIRAAGKELVADGDLRIWVRGHKERFDTSGVCAKAGEGLSCGGSVSASETDVCKDKSSGVRNCRIDLGDGGDFEILARERGVVVKVHKRLELSPAASDFGPFLNLSANDAENRDFLLEPASSDICK